MLLLVPQKITFFVSTHFSIAGSDQLIGGSEAAIKYMSRGILRTEGIIENLWATFISNRFFNHLVHKVTIKSLAPPSPMLNHKKCCLLLSLRVLSSTFRFKNNLFRRDRNAIYQHLHPLSIMKRFPDYPEISYGQHWKRKAIQYI